MRWVFVRKSIFFYSTRRYGQQESSRCHGAARGNAELHFPGKVSRRMRIIAISHGKKTLPLTIAIPCDIRDFAACAKTFILARPLAH
jgi:hypothetical protein